MNSFYQPLKPLISHNARTWLQNVLSIWQTWKFKQIGTETKLKLQLIIMPFQILRLAQWRDILTVEWMIILTQIVKIKYQFKIIRIILY